jgi:ABC-type glycerol-3-phosphate transport system permease component
MLAYAISVDKVKYRNTIALFMFFTMLFGAGLVPWYIVMTQFLHLKNTILALILPMLVSPYNVFLIRNYFKSLPKELVESAEIEGATPLGTLVRVIIPLSTPIIATVALFISLGYWNDWNLSLWLIDRRELFPIQFMLYKINSLINYMKSEGSRNAYGGVSIPKETVQYATVMVTIGPIILMYPFVQKYFVKGIMIGAVKG